MVPCPAKLTIHNARKIDDHTPVCSYTNNSLLAILFVLLSSPPPPPPPSPLKILAPSAPRAWSRRTRVVILRLALPPSSDSNFSLLCAPPNFCAYPTPRPSTAHRRHHVGQAYSVREAERGETRASSGLRAAGEHQADSKPSSIAIVNSDKVRRRPRPPTTPRNLATILTARSVALASAVKSAKSLAPSSAAASSASKSPPILASPSFPSRSVSAAASAPRSAPSTPSPSSTCPRTSRAR